MANSFRSAFNGFNRDDVAHYLEQMNSKHSNQLKELKAENDFLKQQLEAVPKADPAQDERLAELEARCARLEEALSSADAEKKDLETRLENALRDAQTARQQAAAQCQVPDDRADRELEAYRRAERAERVARERAELVYRQTNSVLSDATAKVDDAACQINAIVERISSQMELLQNAVDSSKLALRDAAATMYHIRPNEEN